MSGVVLSGLTAITTISLFEDYNITDIFEDAKKICSWFHNILPDNRFVRLIIYTTGSLLVLRLIPIVLRNTSFFDYFSKEIHFFHRTTSDSQLIEIKKRLLHNFTEGLPLYEDDQLNILELNIGSGTNVSFYPKGTQIIGTDLSEESLRQLENNFLIDDEKIVLKKFVHTTPEELSSVPDSTISCVICFHSLCSTRGPSRALNEMKRVLMDGGKVFFLEHTATKERFTSMWLTQWNFRWQMWLYGCSVMNVERCFQQGGFSQVVFNRFLWPGRNLGPMQALRPHVYGYAMK